MYYKLYMNVRICNHGGKASQSFSFYNLPREIVRKNTRKFFSHSKEILCLHNTGYLVHGTPFPFLCILKMGALTWWGDLSTSRHVCRRGGKLYDLVRAASAHWIVHATLSANVLDWTLMGCIHNSVNMSIMSSVPCHAVCVSNCGCPSLKGSRLPHRS